MRISFHDEDYALAFASEWTDKINDKQENVMSKYTVELDADAIDTIVVNQLSNIRVDLLEEYEKGTTGVFDFDPAEDRRQIAIVIKALETVIDWYSVPGSIKFDELPTFIYGEEDA